MTLPWWERWASLTHRSYPTMAQYKITSAIDMAGWFVEHHAIEAEAFGWRPIHIMRPGSGLAWRWWNLHDPHLSFSDIAMSARWDHGLDFAYSPRRDGSVSVLTGQQREAALYGA